MEEGREPPAADEPLEEFYGDGDPFAFGPAPTRPAVPRPPRPPPKKPRTATGALLTGIAMGLQQVFDPERKKDPVAIEQEAPGEPEGPQRYEVRLNGSPREGQAVYRPWVDPEDT